MLVSSISVHQRYSLSIMYAATAHPLGESRNLSILAIKPKKNFFFCAVVSSVSPKVVSQISAHLPGKPGCFLSVISGQLCDILALSKMSS